MSIALPAPAPAPAPPTAPTLMIATGPSATVEVGTTLSIPATITSISTGLPIDPLTLQLVARTPTGVSSTFTLLAGQITRSSLGMFFYAWSFTLAGRHLFIWSAPGAEQTMEIQVVRTV